MSEVSIRLLLPTDGKNLLALHSDAILAIEDRFYTHAQKHSWSHGRNEGGYLKAVENGETIYVATNLQDEAIGFCGVRDTELQGLFIAPQWQSKGVGTKLLLHAENAVRNAGAAQFEVRAALSAIGFYAKHGYVEFEQDSHTTRGGKVIEVRVMRKDL